MTRDEWKRVTHRLAGTKSQFFKPRENQIIQDFIETASADEGFWVGDIDPETLKPKVLNRRSA